MKSWESLVKSLGIPLKSLANPKGSEGDPKGYPPIVGNGQIPQIPGIPRLLVIPNPCSRTKFATPVCAVPSSRAPGTLPPHHHGTWAKRVKLLPCIRASVHPPQSFIRASVHRLSRSSVHPCIENSTSVVHPCIRASTFVHPCIENSTSVVHPFIRASKIPPQSKTQQNKDFHKINENQPKTGKFWRL